MDETLTWVYIGVGSNISPEENIVAALVALRERIEVKATSTFFRTAPLLGRDQGEYLNGVWRACTTLSPRALKFDVLRGIEADLHRTRREDRYAPRTIDLDLLLFGNLVLQEEDLVLPDPEIRERPFIAVPLAELAPNLVLPGMDLRVADYCRHAAEGMRPDIAFTERLREILREKGDTTPVSVP